MSPTPIRDPNAPPDPTELREIPTYQHAPPEWAGQPHNPVPPREAVPPPVEPPSGEVAPPGGFWGYSPDYGWGWFPAGGGKPMPGVKGSPVKPAVPEHKQEQKDDASKHEAPKPKK